MATLEKLQAQIAKLQTQAEALVARQSSGVVEKIRAIMDRHGLTIADIDAHIGGTKKRGRKPGVKTAVKASASVAKYRDPKSGATWTGHGRAPAWIASAKDRNRYLIEGASSVPAPAGKKAAKAGNYVRGPQAPRYRDPKSGATWSGRGPAPAWLAGAKDRTKFLIAGATEGTAQPKGAAAKKPGATAKKPAATKRAMKSVATPAKKALAKKAVAKKIVVKRAKKSVVASKAPVGSAPATTSELTGTPASV